MPSPFAIGTVTLLLIGSFLYTFRMRAFFGVVFILIGSLMFLCGGIFVTGNAGNEGGLGLVLGIIPGGLLLAIGIRLFGWDSSKKKIAKSDEDPK